VPADQPEPHAVQEKVRRKAADGKQIEPWSVNEQTEERYDQLTQANQ